MTILLALFLQGSCAADCPSSKAHLQSVEHTQGKACACGARIDVCFKLCRDCAANACRGCGGRIVEPLKVWKSAEAAKTEVRLDGDVVAVTRAGVRGTSRLEAVREFDDRVELSYATGTPLCGNEPRVNDALFVRLPPLSKKLVVRHLRHDLFGGHKVEIVGTFP